MAAPGSAITGGSINVTATACDSYGNIVPQYVGTAKLVLNGVALGSNYKFTYGGVGADNGVHTFSVILNQSGNQQITVTDTVATQPIITGTSNAILVSSLQVNSFTSTPTGFAVRFNKPFVADDLALYGGNLTTFKDVVVAGAHVGPIHGSLLIDSTATSLIFNATNTYLQELNDLRGHISAVLPDDTYTVTLLSGSGGNGFLDELGAALDGRGNGGQANFATTFTTHYQASSTPVLGIPDFARGPDSTTTIAVPNNAAQGIPLTLYNAAGVSDLTFTLNYNPIILNITGVLAGGNSDATDPAGTFTLISNVSGVATFDFHDANAQSGMVVLGDILAVVPDSAKNQYKAKELLQLGNIVVNGNANSGTVSANGVHVNAYLGDVTGDGKISGLDTLTANQVATGAATGFAAYKFLDPVIIGDPANDLSVDAGDVSVLDLYVVQLQPAQVPAPPGYMVTSPNAADPTLNLVAGDSSRGLRTVSINIDHPKPIGSTGLAEATLALTYDPSLLTVSFTDITLGNLPNQGSGWQLSSSVDQTTGQIGIDLYSLTPISVNQAGSLVTIAFHIIPGQSVSATPVQFVTIAMPNGQRFTTTVADTLGAMILSPGENQVQVSVSGYPGFDEPLALQTRHVSATNHGEVIPPTISKAVSIGEGESDSEILAPPIRDKETQSAVLNFGQITHIANVAMPQVASPPLQIGIFAGLDTLLYENSPAISAITRNFRSFYGEAIKSPEPLSFPFISGAPWDGKVQQSDWQYISDQTTDINGDADSWSAHPRTDSLDAHTVDVALSFLWDDWTW